ncbi:MAG TPA: ATP-dependent helicase [Anaerolineae bacterium]|nr:ATP-dependent helicase [Anaerolineae bacterium]
MPWDEGLYGPAREIAETDESPLCVVAGPGTGKTFALMRRVARLLEQGVEPGRILLVTFTRVAANDLERELRRLRVRGVDRVRKGTLHSFCFATLQQAAVLAFIGRVPRPMLKFEERFLLEDVQGEDFGDYYARRTRLRALGAAWARQQDQEPGWPTDEVDRRFYWAVDEWLRFHEAILLDELVPLTLAYVRNNPACTERRQFDHVLVDEYQDLNPAEQTLIHLLGEGGSVAVAGDEDQSIYETLRFAHPEGISGYVQAHNAYPVGLDESRRLPTRIIEIAGELISNNVQRTGRTLTASAGNCEGDIDVVQWDTMEEEVDGIASFVSHKVTSGEFDPGQTLVLCPRRDFGFMIRDALVQRGCPAHTFFHQELLKADSKRLDESRTQQAFTLLTLLARPGDRVALRCWLGFGSQNLLRGEYRHLREHCSLDCGPTEALDQMVAGSLSIPYTSHITARYRQFCQLRSHLAGASAQEIVDTLFPEEDPWTEPFRATIEQCSEGFTLHDVFDALRTSVTQPELPTDVDYVRIMSLHKAKGLNADHVVVTGCIEGLIPSRDSRVPPRMARRAVEEQRRLFYVAITRPRKTLVLSSSLRLPVALAYKMGANVRGGEHDYVDTIGSTLVGELGPRCPRAVRGEEWTY